jgi:hypothetical protein
VRSSWKAVDATRFANKWNEKANGYGSNHVVLMELQLGFFGLFGVQEFVHQRKLQHNFATQKIELADLFTAVNSTVQSLFVI